MAILWSLLKTLRPRQWIKNFAVFAALVFSGLLFHEGSLQKAAWTFVVFALLSGSTYIFNDLLDVEADRNHPYKKMRPIASGKLPLPVAIFSLILGVFCGLTLAYTLNYYVFLLGFIYLVIQVFYTTYFKKIPIIDLIVIATGYLIRVYAGALVVGAHMSVWFLMTVIAASLFLAVGKRRGEMTLLLGRYKTANTRVTLKRYTEQLLDIYTAMFATGTWITYALFTFNHPVVVPDGRALQIISILPRTFVSEKWLMATIPLVVYGVMRYLQVIYEKNEGESPERVILSDKPLLVTGITWVVMVIGVLYYVG